MGKTHLVLLLLLAAYEYVNRGRRCPRAIIQQLNSWMSSVVTEQLDDMRMFLNVAIKLPGLYGNLAMKAAHKPALTFKVCSIWTISYM